MAHTGSFSSAAAQRTPLIMTVKGVRVAFLAYTELTNGIPSPNPWSVNRASAAQILSDAHHARADGAQVVIVNIHWADEDVAQPSRFQLALASRLTRSPDITAIVGQHVHIVQPIRIINGKLVVLDRAPSASPRRLLSAFTQFPRVPSLIPRSRATCAIGLPVSRTSRTAPSLKS